MSRSKGLGINEIPFNAVLKVALGTGQIVTGDYIDWTSALDNEPDGESISVRMNGVAYELFLDEVVSIEVVGTY